MIGSIVRLLTTLLAHFLDGYKTRRENRLTQIQQWKSNLLANELYIGANRNEDGAVSAQNAYGLIPPEMAYRRLVKAPTFESFAVIASKEALAKLNKFNRSTITISESSQALVRLIVAAEITRIEKRWRLI